MHLKMHGRLYYYLYLVALVGLFIIVFLEKLMLFYVSIASYLCPMVAILLGIIILYVKLSWNIYLGAVVILFSMFIIMSKHKQIFIKKQKHSFLNS